MVFLSKVCRKATQSLKSFQLKDPHAVSFTHVELRNAMMETIELVNKLSKEAGVVSIQDPVGLTESRPTST